MIRISITSAAYEAIIATLPAEGAPLWPVERQGGQCLIPRRGRRRRPPAGHAPAGRGLQGDVTPRLVELEVNGLSAAASAQ